MQKQITLPMTDPITTTRYVANKIGQHTLNQIKGHKKVDFTRATAHSEEELISHLSISDLGDAALGQYTKKDTYLHFETFS